MKTKNQVVKEIMTETGISRDFCEQMIYPPSMRKEEI